MYETKIYTRAMMLLYTVQEEIRNVWKLFLLLWIPKQVREKDLKVMFDRPKTMQGKWIGKFDGHELVPLLEQVQQ
jgi:hypothetical protein